MKSALKTFLPALAAAFAALPLGGCATVQTPAAGPEALAAERAAAPGPAGYLGLTMAVDMGTFTGYPALTLDLRDVGSGAVRHLRVEGAELAAHTKGGEETPLVFVLPVGRYEVSGSLLHLPGGRLGRREYADSDQALGLEHSLQPFAVEADKLAHLAVVRLTLKETLANYTLFFNTSTLVQMARPPAAAWQPYAAVLAPGHAVYLKKTQIGTYAWPPLTLAGGGRQTLPESEIKRVTHARQADVEACYLRNSPRAHGRLEARYVVAPAGTVHEAAVTTSTLKQPATEACIVGIIKSLKFPATPDDDYETWTAAWSF